VIARTSSARLALQFSVSLSIRGALYLQAQGGKQLQIAALCLRILFLMI
jgi:hypothetical protein